MASLLTAGRRYGTPENAERWTFLSACQETGNNTCAFIVFCVTRNNFARAGKSAEVLRSLSAKLACSVLTIFGSDTQRGTMAADADAVLALAGQRGSDVKYFARTNFIDAGLPHAFCALQSVLSTTFVM